MQRSRRHNRTDKAHGPGRRLVRSLAWAALAVVGLLATFAIVVFVLALSSRSTWGFPLAVAFAYTVGVAIFVLSPGRGSKGYNPFGPVVRRALGPLLRLHAVYVVLVLAAFHLQHWAWRHAGPWWTTSHGSRHTTHLGTAEFLVVFLLVFTESFRATILLSDAEPER